MLTGELVGGVLDGGGDQAGGEYTARRPDFGDVDRAGGLSGEVYLDYIVLHKCQLLINFIVYIIPRSDEYVNEYPKNNSFLFGSKLMLRFSGDYITVLRQ